MKIAARILLAVAVIAFLTGCTSAPRYRSSSVEVSSSDVDGNEVVTEAKKYLGVPYRNGGTTTNGLDCSGLVVTVYENFGVALPRTSHDQSSFGAKVERSRLEPGDLVFFRTSGTTRISHVGIYSGDGQFIHASTRSKRVKYDRLDNKYFKKRYATARRVL
jgi:cell wall-associated NlpC family hydrolase